MDSKKVEDKVDEEEEEQVDEEEDIKDDSEENENNEDDEYNEEIQQKKNITKNKKESNAKVKRRSNKRRNYKRRNYNKSQKSGLIGKIINCCGIAVIIIIFTVIVVLISLIGYHFVIRPYLNEKMGSNTHNRRTSGQTGDSYLQTNLDETNNDVINKKKIVVPEPEPEPVSKELHSKLKGVGCHLVRHLRVVRNATEQELLSSAFSAMKFKEIFEFLEKCRDVFMDDVDSTDQTCLGHHNFLFPNEKEGLQALNVISIWPDDNEKGKTINAINTNMTGWVVGEYANSREIRSTRSNKKHKFRTHNTIWITFYDGDSDYKIGHPTLLRLTGRQAMCVQYLLLEQQGLKVDPLNQ